MRHRIEQYPQQETKTNIKNNKSEVSVLFYFTNHQDGVTKKSMAKQNKRRKNQ
jgi:hypothetical protein